MGKPLTFCALTFVLLTFVLLTFVPFLISIHVVFGRVVDGNQFVSEIENQKVDVNHRPYADVRITHSGELVLLKKKGSNSTMVVSAELESNNWPLTNFQPFPMPILSQAKTHFGWAMQNGLTLC